MSEVVTEWFPANVKPAWPGVYEVQGLFHHIEPFRLWSMWDGGRWLWVTSKREKAPQMVLAAMAQERPWRGIVPPVLS